MLLSKFQRNADGTRGPMSDFWTVTVASEQAGYPGSNLLTPSLEQKWVSWGQRMSHNWIELNSEFFISESYNTIRYLDFVSLFGIDRRAPSFGTGIPPTNSYRVIIDTYPIATRHRPAVASVSLTNLTGSYTVLNGPLDPPNLVPDGYVQTKMVQGSHTTNTILIATFENHNSTERPLSDDHVFRVHYADSVNINTVPTLTVQLRYNGVNVATLTSSITEKTSEGYIFSYYWNSSQISGTTGTVGVHIVGTTTGSSTPIPIGLEWIAELDGWIWDSLLDTSQDGSIATTQIVETPTGTSRNDPGEGTVPIEILPGEVIYIYYEFSDFASYTISPGPIRHYTVLGGFEGAAFFAGRAIVSEGLTLNLIEPGGLNHRKGSDVGISRMYGGSARGSRNPLTWTEHDIQSEPVPRSRIVPGGDLDEFFELAGMRNPVVMIPDPSTDPSQALYVLITSWDTPDRGQLDEEFRHDVLISAIDHQARRTL